MVKKAKRQSKIPAPKAPPPPPVDREVIPLITMKNFATLRRRHASEKKEMSASRGTIGQMIAEACEKQHLHKGAYGIFDRIDAMSVSKRNSLLIAFDHMRSMADWDDQLDLFKTKAAEGVVEDEESDAGVDEDDGDEQPRSNGRHRDEVVPSI